MRTLAVALTSSILGTSLIGREPGNSTIGIHIDEVQSAIETVREAQHVDIEGEFLVLQVEHLVLADG